MTACRHFLLLFICLPFIYLLYIWIYGKHKEFVSRERVFGYFEYRANLRQCTECLLIVLYLLLSPLNCAIFILLVNIYGVKYDFF